MFACLDTASIVDMPASLGRVVKLHTIRDRPVVETASGVSYIGCGTVHIEPVRVIVPCDTEV